MGCGASTSVSILDFQKVYTTEGMTVDRARERRRDLLADVVYDHLICSRLPDDAQEEMIDRMTPTYRAAKEVVCREGQRCERFYIVAEGTLSVKSATNRLTPGYGVEEIDTLKSGRTFGDVNLVLDQCRHRETVTCLTKCELWEVPLAQIPQIAKIRDAGTRHLVASRLIAQAAPDPVMVLPVPDPAAPGMGRAPTLARQGTMAPPGAMQRQNSLTGAPGMARRDSLGAGGGPAMTRQGSFAPGMPPGGMAPAFARQGSFAPGMPPGGMAPAFARQGSFAPGMPPGGMAPAFARQASMAAPGGMAPAFARQASMAAPGGMAPAFARQASMAAPGGMAPPGMPGAPGLAYAPTMGPPGARASTGAHAGGAGGFQGGSMVTHALKTLGTTRNKDDPFSYLPPAQYGNFQRRNSMGRGPVVRTSDGDGDKKRGRRTTTATVEEEAAKEKRDYRIATEQDGGKDVRRVMASHADQAEKDWNSTKQKGDPNAGYVVTPFGRVDISIFKRKKDDD